MDNTLNYQHDHICILGSGGHAKCVLDTIYNQNNIIQLPNRLKKSIVTPLLHDDDQTKLNNEVYGAKVVDSIANIKFRSSYLFCAIGNNKIRREIVEKINNSYWIIIKGVNNSISNSVEIGEGTLILNNTNIGPDVKIGKHCIINNHSNIDHDCVIGDYVHIAPNVTLCGNVEIDDGTLIGAGAIIVPNIKIGKNLLIKAGSVIKCDILTDKELNEYYKNK